jgi:hypothetical protein
MEEILVVGTGMTPFGRMLGLDGIEEAVGGVTILAN